MEFNEKVIVITGAAGEIGRAVAEKFAQEGAYLVLVDINQEGLNRLASDLSYDPDKIFIFQADLRDESQVQNYVHKAVELLGSIDALVHCAGILGNMGIALQLSAKDLTDVFESNVITSFLSYKYIYPIMQKQQKGSILFIGSVYGMKGVPFYTPYTVASHGLIGLTKTSALDSSASNIRVNVICPSPVNTEMMRETEAQLSPQDAERAKRDVAQLIPFGKYAEIEDIVELVTFLSSDRAKFITGACHVVDGGLTAK